MTIADHDPATGRTRPEDEFSEFEHILAVFSAGITVDPDLYAAAYNLVVMGKTPEQLPRMLEAPVTVFPIWNGQYQPVEIIPALVSIIDRTGAKDIVYSGGRTNSSWPETQNEAQMLGEQVAAQTLLDVNTYFEKRSVNTRDNARFMCELFPKMIAESRSLIFVAHLIHTSRVMMTKRQVLCHDYGLMSEAEFDARAQMVAYDTGIPRLDPRDPQNLAQTLTRLKIYSEAGHIKPTAKEAETLRKLYTRAEEYALKAQHDRLTDTRRDRRSERRAAIA